VNRQEIAAAARFVGFVVALVFFCVAFWEMWKRQ
jgi:hypothetical protein